MLGSCPRFTIRSWTDLIHTIEMFCRHCRRRWCSEAGCESALVTSQELDLDSVYSFCSSPLLIDLSQRLFKLFRAIPIVSKGVDGFARHTFFAQVSALRSEESFTDCCSSSQAKRSRSPNTGPGPLCDGARSGHWLVSTSNQRIMTCRQRRRSRPLFRRHCIQ